MDEPRDRSGEVRRLTEEMDRSAALSEGHFNALGMLLTDASLAADGAALVAAQDGLQWLFRRYSGLESPRADEIEHRGRLLGLIDTTHWALRRLPSALQLTLDPEGHAARFLLAVAREPGLSNQEVAARLGVDETEASRVGRRLLATGMVWRRREWRRNVWDLTPRGQQYLTASGLHVDGDDAGQAPDPAIDDIRLEYAVGVKVLPSLLVGVVTDRAAEVVGEVERPLPGPLMAEEAAAELATFVRDLLAAVPEASRNLAGVGIGVEIGGHVSTVDGTVVYAPNYAPHGDWAGFSLADELERELGLPTVVENDANALAEWEHAFGDNAGIGYAATVVLDEGVGCGLVVDGRVVHGSGGSAGEIGHVVVDPQGGLCRCGNHGCLETVAGTVAITDAISDGIERKVADLTAAAVLAEHDERVAATIGRAGTALGQGLSALLNLVNPAQVVLYGPAELVDESAYASARAFMAGVRESSARYSFSNAGRDCRIVHKPYSYRVGAQAAAAVALRRRVPRT